MAGLELLSFLDLEPIYFTGFQSTSDEIEEFSDSESEEQAQPKQPVEQEEGELLESSHSSRERTPEFIPESPERPGTSDYYSQSYPPLTQSRGRDRLTPPRVRSRSPRFSQRSSSPVKHYRSVDRDRDYRPRKSASPTKHRSLSPRRSPRRRPSPRKSTECWEPRNSRTRSPDRVGDKRRQPQSEVHQRQQQGSEGFPREGRSSISEDLDSSFRHGIIRSQVVVPPPGHKHKLPPEGHWTDEYSPEESHGTSKAKKSPSKKEKKDKKKKEKEDLIFKKLQDLLTQTLAAKEADQPEDSSDAPKKVTSIWKAFRSLVFEAHPEVTEPEAPRPVYRTVGSELEPAATPLRLPFHPAVASAVEACEDAIYQPISKTGQKLDPLPVGELLKSQRTFHQRYWDVEGEYQLAFPLRRNTHLPKSIFPPGVSAVKFTKLADKELQTQEQNYREALCVWSAIR